jgi:hypothetical protein
MISSSSCSTKPALLALAGVVLSACAHGGARDGGAALSVTRVALFPVESDGAGPRDSFTSAMELAIARAGLDIVSAAPVERVLAERRVRTLGIDAAAAQVAREELGLEAVILVNVERYVTTEEPVLSVEARLVSVQDRPRVLWMDGFSQAAAASHGLLGLGGFRSMDELEREAAARLSRSLAAFIRTGEQRGRCGGRHFRPGSSYRAPAPLPGRRVAVLPFLSQGPSPSRSAGDAVALHLVRQFAASGRFDVLDPGEVRDALRRERIVTRGGVSLAEAQRMGKRLEADLVVSGEVVQYLDAAVPKVEFGTIVLDRNERVVWRSSTRSTGDDAVSVFDFGRLATVSEVACRMAAGVVEGILAGEPDEWGR